MALSFRATKIVAITNATQVSSGMAVSVGDFVFATIAGDSTAALEITAVSSFADAAGNTWTVLEAPTQNADASNSASMVTYYSVITQATTSLAITSSFTATTGSKFLVVDCITGFVGTATLDTGGATTATTGVGTTATSLSIPVLGSGTGHQAVEACYVVCAAGASLGATVQGTAASLTGTQYTLGYNSADCVASYGFITSVAPTSASAIAPSWTTARVALGVGATVYDSGANTPVSVLVGDIGQTAWISGGVDSYTIAMSNVAASSHLVLVDMNPTGGHYVTPSTTTGYTWSLIQEGQTAGDCSLSFWLGTPTTGSGGSFNVTVTYVTAPQSDDTGGTCYEVLNFGSIPTKTIKAAESGSGTTTSVIASSNCLVIASASTNGQNISGPISPWTRQVTGGSPYGMSSYQAGVLSGTGYTAAYTGSTEYITGAIVIAPPAPPFEASPPVVVSQAVKRASFR